MLAVCLLLARNPSDIGREVEAKNKSTKRLSEHITQRKSIILSLSSQQAEVQFETVCSSLWPMQSYGQMIASMCNICDDFLRFLNDRRFFSPSFRTFVVDQLHWSSVFVCWNDFSVFLGSLILVLNCFSRPDAAPSRKNYKPNSNTSAFNIHLNYSISFLFNQTNRSINIYSGNRVEPSQFGQLSSRSISRPVRVYICLITNITHREKLLGLFTEKASPVASEGE